MTTSQLLVSTDQAGVELPADAPRYSLLVAHANDEVVAAQKLRHRVFAEEMGARLHSPAARSRRRRVRRVLRPPRGPRRQHGRDRRLLPDAAAGARRQGREAVRRQRVRPERARQPPRRPWSKPADRACTRTTAAAPSSAWSGPGSPGTCCFPGHRYLAGCASVPLVDGGSFAAGVWDVLRTKHYSDEATRVSPLIPWDAVGHRAPGARRCCRR